MTENIKIGEIRYYRWGDEPVGYVSIWTIKKNKEVLLLGRMTTEEIRKYKYIYECPYS